MRRLNLARRDIDVELEIRSRASRHAGWRPGETNLLLPLDLKERIERQAAGRKNALRLIFGWARTLHLGTWGFVLYNLVRSIVFHQRGYGLPTAVITACILAGTLMIMLTIDDWRHSS